MPEIIFPQDLIKNVYKPETFCYMYFEGRYWKRLCCLTVRSFGYSIVDKNFSYKIKNNLFKCDIKFLFVIGNSVFNPKAKINIDCVLGAEFKLCAY